jgi:hypothetical protein
LAASPDLFYHKLNPCSKSIPKDDILQHKMVCMERMELDQFTGPVSLLLRLSSTGEAIDKIASQHEEIIRMSGNVWLGVFGTKLSTRTLEILESRGEYLYMMQMGKAGAVGYRGSLAGASNVISASDLNLIPRYYKEKRLTPLVKFWVRLSSLRPVSINELAELRVARTGTMALDLFRSMTSVAIVIKPSALPSKLSRKQETLRTH